MTFALKECCLFLLCATVLIAATRACLQCKPCECGPAKTLLAPHGNLAQMLIDIQPAFVHSMDSSVPAATYMARLFSEWW